MNTKVACTKHSVTAVVTLRNIKEKGRDLRWGVAGSPSSPPTGSHWPATNPESPEATTRQKQPTSFSENGKKETETESLGSALPLDAPIQVTPSQRILLELVIGKHSSYANKGVAPAQKRFQRLPLTPVQTPYGQIWRAPTFYHYSPVPMVDHLNESVLRCCKLPRCLCFLLLLVILMALLVALVIFAVRANSKHCTDGLQAEQECQNLTRYVQHQLTQAQEVLQKMEVQAATCNQTVVSHFTP